jgi:hypothetical protein
MYDVYYTTAGGPWFNSGADMWVTQWITEVAPHLEVKPLLLFHRHKPQNYEEFPINIDHIWETSEDEILKIFEGARRIHILHGHYTPTRAIHQSLEKIDSIVFHNLTRVSLMAQMEKDSYLHWYGNWEYESEMIDKIKNKVWIGLYHFPYKTENLYHIPNCYEFKVNKEVSESLKIGFAARAEGRKNLEFIEPFENYISTNSETFNKYYRKKYGHKFEKSKIYKFDYKYKERFYGLDWGVSHSCFEFEPFGYGIFEAVDWGKVPILHENWCIPLDYKYKAKDAETFKETYEQICKDSYEERKTEHHKLKDWMKMHFGNKDVWKEKLLDIYNGE